MSIFISKFPISPNDVGQVTKTIWSTGSSSSEMDHGNAGLNIGNASNMNDVDIRESGYIIFPNIDIPPGSVINSAKLKFQGSSSGNEPVLSTIYFNNIANAVPLVSVAEFDDAPLTSGVSWNTTETIPDDEDRWTSELSAILQPIIDKAGWVSGNSVMLIFKENGNDILKYRYIDGYKSQIAGYSKTRLEIDYSPPYYEGEISESFSISDQYGSNADTSVNSSVVAAFDTPFVYDIPNGFMPFGYGFMPLVWDNDYRGSEVQKTSLYPFPEDDSALYTTTQMSTNTSSSAIGSCIATTGKTEGKWYWEIVVAQNEVLTGTSIGKEIPLVTPRTSVGISNVTINSEIQLGIDSGSYGLTRDGRLKGNNNEWDYGDGFGPTDVIGIALDLDNNKIWFSKNGEWLEGGDPAGGINEAIAITSMKYFPAGTAEGYTNNVMTVDSWGRYIPVLSERVDDILLLNVTADSLLYPVPTGFYPYASDPQITEAEIAENFSTADANDVAVLFNEGPVDHEGVIDESFTTNDWSYGALPGDTEDPTSLTSSNSFTMDDLIEATGTSREIEENFSIADEIEATAPQRAISEGFTVDDAISVNIDPWHASISEDVESGDIIESPIYGEDDENVTTADASEVVLERSGSISESITTADEITSVKGKGALLTEVQHIFETLGWTWIKSLTSTAEISDEVSVEVGIPIHDVLTAQDTVESQWSGTESVESSLGMFGSAVISQIFNEAVTSTANMADASACLHKMISVVNSSLTATDTVLSKATFNPVVLESVAITGLLSVLHTLNLEVSDSAAIADSLGFGWIETIEDGAAIVDAAAVRLLIIHLLTSNLVATDAAAVNLNLTDELTDTLGIAATVAVKQILQEHITEILHFGIVVELDGELWECWVLNTNAFHASVYSGFSFNSYAVHNNTAYGCKSDGIYKLSGDTDDGSEFKTGIVLPESRFGTHNFKRFRKAYFGMVGSSPAIKMVNEDGAGNTYAINNSKVTPTRGVKGRRWTLSVEGFDSLDFVELVPIMLTR